MVKKRALYRDTVREIRNTLGRFLSILLIAALGTASFAGIRTAGPVMERSFDDYAEKTRFMDIRFASTVGFEAQDVDAIAALDGVGDVMATYQADVLAMMNGASAVVKLLCAHEGASALNRPQVIEGRLPQNDGECALDDEHFKSVALGDVIRLSSGTDDPLSDTVARESLTVVGRVRSPLYASLMRDSSALGSGVVNGFVVVHPGLFSLSVYTDVYVRLHDQTMSVFDDAYEPLRDEIVARAEDLGVVRGAQWYADTVAEAKAALDDGQREYDDAAAEAKRALSAGQRRIDAGWAEIEQGEGAIAAAREALAAQTDAGAQGILAARAALDEGYAAYEEAYAQFLAQRDELPDAEREQTQMMLDAQKGGLDAAAADIDEGERAMLQEAAEAEAYLEGQEAELESGRASLRSAQRTLRRSRAEADEALAEAKDELEQAARDIEDIPEAKWYVLGLDANAGFLEYSLAAERMRSIAKVFPAFFFFIAALVCLTTMTRMVDEQRANMGTLKALGYTARDIAGKYLIYAAIASVTGSVLGVVVGMWLFPSVIFNAYSLMFSVPGPLLMFHMPNAAMAVLIAVGVTLSSTLLACRSQLSDTPAEMMRPKAPKPGKPILLERIGFLWRRLNFSLKVTARNLFRYKRRLWMTLIGIAGCTALLVTGFGIRDSLRTLSKRQYGEVFLYHLSVTVKDNLPRNKLADATEAIRALDDVRTLTAAHSKAADFSTPGSVAQKQATLMVFEDDAAIKKAVSLQTRREKTPIALGESGAVINEKMAMEMGVAVGDTIVMADGDKRYDIIVTGVCENYVQHFVYMSDAAYEAAAGEANAPNQFFLTVADGADLDRPCAQILSLPDVTQVAAYTQFSESIEDTVSGLDSVVWVLIGAAAALAFVVMYNLTNINIGERLREIATLKVLGFTPREVAMYVLRENVVLSLIGIAIGSVLGTGLHRYIMTTVEMDGMMFGRQIFAMSFVIAAAMTFLFTMIVNVAMMPRLKRIDMVDSLKAVE